MTLVMFNRVRQSLREREDWLSVIRRTGRSTELSLWLFQEQISNRFLEYKLYKRWSSSLLWRDILLHSQISGKSDAVETLTILENLMESYTSGLTLLYSQRRYLLGNFHYRSTQIWRRNLIDFGSLESSLLLQLQMIWYCCNEEDMWDNKTLYWPKATKYSSPEESLPYSNNRRHIARFDESQDFLGSRF